MVAVPIKSVVGIKVTLVPPTMVAVPLVGLTAIMVRVPPGVSSTSLASGVSVLVAFSAILYTSGFASGGRFVTVIVISELFVPPILSVIVYPIVAVPRKSFDGVNSTFVPPKIVAVPLVGLTAMILSVPPGV